MNGIIVINKEANYTSRDVVNILNKVLNTKKIGHTGTLDPMACGVLVMCIGNATKLVDLITAYDKEYVAEITLGIKTDTLDITGNVIDIKDAIYTKEEIVNKLNQLVGTYLQEVPAYSAVKINGKKLYEYARENISVTLPKKEVTIYSLDLISDIKYVDNKAIFAIKTKVSKGTYIRSLINDLAISLNTIGVMSKLTRTKQGNFDINDAYTLDDVRNNQYKLLNIEDFLPEYKKIVTNDFKVINGNSIKNIYNENKVMFTDEQGKVIGLYISDGDMLKPFKMLKE